MKLFPRKRRESGSRESDLDSEIAAHLALAAQERINRGEAPHAAAAAARRELGNTALVKEATREAWGGLWLGNLARDLRHALYHLRRSPGAYLSCVLLIALGVAANTQIFAFVEAVLLRPLPVKDPQNLVQLFELHPKIIPQRFFTSATLRAIRERSKTVSSLIGAMEMTGNATHNGTAERIHFIIVTGDYFEKLGVTAALGRTITPGDTQAAVLSHSYWTRSFAADPHVLGRTVSLFNRAFTVVGVAPPSFVGTQVDAGPEVWVPLEGSYNITGNPARTVDAAYRDNFATEIIGRLKSGVTLRQAQAELAGIFEGSKPEQVHREPESKNWIEESRLEVRSIAHGISPLRDQSSTALWLLSAGSGLLLLMVAATVGGLLLARASAREKEIAVRLALGAGRAHIIRMWVIESLLLAGAGGLLGILAAYATLPLALHWLPPARGIGGDITELRARSLELSPDLRVIAASVLGCALVAALASLAPVLRSSRRDLWTALKITLGGDRHHRRFQAALCLAQVTICTVALLFGGWTLRSLAMLRASNPGFVPSRVAAFAIDPVAAGYDAPRTRALQQRLLDGAGALSGVDSAALASRSVMHGTGSVTYVVFPGRPPEGQMNTSTNTVSPGYFETMGIHLLQGRNLFMSSTGQNLKPAVVNQEFARRFFPGRNPIGQVFAEQRKWIAPEFEIVGVVNNTKYRSLREVSPPIFYKADFGPMPQFDRFALHVRTHGAPEAIVPAIRKLLASIDPRVSFHEVATLTGEIDGSLWQERMLAGLASIFGIFALTLTLGGLYGIVDHFVTQRRHEIALRLALGAPAASLTRLIARQFAAILGIGLVCGAAIAFAGSGWAASLFYQITRLDTPSIASALGLMAAAALLAGAKPLWNALHVDPASALRQE